MMKTFKLRELADAFSAAYWTEDEKRAMDAWDRARQYVAKLDGDKTVKIGAGETDLDYESEFSDLADEMGLAFDAYGNVVTT